MMDRRQLLLLSIGGASATLVLPRALRAQAGSPMPRVAVLPELLTRQQLETAAAALEVPAEPSPQASWAGFFIELRRLGHVPGESVEYDLWTLADIGALGGSRPFLEALLARDPDVIVMHVWQLLPELMALEHETPILTYAPDLVALGLVDNVARPERNLTGLSYGVSVEMLAKQIQLLAEMSGDPRIAVVIAEQNLALPGADAFQEGIAMLARVGIEVVPMPVPAPPASEAAAIEAWLVEVARGLTEAGFKTALLIDVGDFDFDRALTARVMREAGLATTMAGGGHAYARAGGLMSYGSSGPEGIRALAEYAHRILGGSAPADLPFQHPTTFVFGINRTTATALGIKVPTHLELQATGLFD
jgi:putative ABC transport system substrate-binding protein